MQTLTHDGLLTLAGAMVMLFLSIGTCFFITRLIARFCHIDSAPSGIVSSAFTVANNVGYWLKFCKSSSVRSDTLTQSGKKHCDSTKSRLLAAYLFVILVT